MGPPTVREGLGEQPEDVAHAHVLPREEPGSRRRIVGGDGCEGRPPPGVRGGHPIPVGGGEPHDIGAEHSPAGEVGAHPRLVGAEVLADDQRPGAVGLKDGDANQRLVILGDVGAVHWQSTCRHPPQPEQAEDVIDSDPAALPHHRAHHLAEGPVARLAQGIGTPGRLIPVLSELVVRIRRAADAHGHGVHVLLGPRRRTMAMNADRQVVDDSQRHPGIARRPLGLTSLAVALPLHPAVVVDLVSEAGLIAGTEHTRAAQVRWPGAPVGSMPGGDRHVVGVVGQALAHPGAEVVELLDLGRRSAERPPAMRIAKDGALGRGGPVPVEQSGRGIPQAPAGGRR